MAIPAQPQNMAVAEGDCTGTPPVDRTKACVTWDVEPNATSAELVVTPGLTTYTQKPPRQQIVVSNLAPGTIYQFELSNVSDDGKSPPAIKDLTVEAGKTPPWWSYSSFILLGLLVLAAALCGAGALWWYSSQGERVAFYSSALALALLALALLLPTLTGGPFGVWRIILGQDNRISTSKSQAFLWTLLVEFILVYFASRTWFAGEQHLFDGVVPGGTNAGTGSAWPDYLVLLGGPFAALVVAKASVSSKTAAGAVQKSAAGPDGASLTQVVTDDDGNPDLVDTQYFLFNLAALAYVIFGLASTNQLPQIPGLLLALSGGSAAVYAGNKTIAQNKPVISDLSPLTARVGDIVTITGSNFKPPGVTALPTVSIGQTAAMVKADSSDSSIQAIVPVGTQQGPTKVIVTTAAGVASDPEQFNVVADVPVIFSVSPPAAGEGDPLTIDAVGLFSNIDGSHLCNVTFTAADGTPLPSPDPPQPNISSLASGLDRVEVKIPELPENTTKMSITVTTFRGTSATYKDYALKPKPPVPADG
jgi:hypothetical protein